MKRRVVALAAACFVLAIAALAYSVQPRHASSQTATGHEHHDQAADQAAGAEKPTTDGQTASLPGVPPGTPVIGGGVTTTITAEVMDPACFLEAGPKSIGKGHFQCAVDCARSGQTLALYDRALDRIYFIAGELPGRNPNDPLMRYIHQKVDVLGTVYHRSQAWGIVIIKVTPHKETPAAPAKPAAPKAGTR